jgi:hypothetical protein
MKSKILIFISIIILPLFVKAQQFPDYKLGAFQPGEKLTYEVKYGFITAAEAVLEVQEGKKEINGQKVWHYVASGKTTRSFDFLMKVRNRYDSYVDVNDLLPEQFTENVKEGNYKRDSYANFDRKLNRVTATKGIYTVPDHTLDIISAFYFSRCIDLKDISIGEKFHLDYFLDDGAYPLDVEYVGKETIKTTTGKYSCIKFSPSLQPGRVFRKDSKMYIWITDDANRIPVKVEVEILIGSLILELQSYEGLKNPLTSKR